MALATKSSFKEYYNALVSRKPTEQERINEIIRSELCFRKLIEKQQWTAFEDVLHVAGLMIMDKKRMEKGDVPLGLTAAQQEEYHKNRRVWFPKLEPRQVPPRTRPGPVGYPHKASREIQAEEPEIRSWIAGVEAKLRESIIKKREDSLLMIRKMDLIRAKEERARTRFLSEENEQFACIRKKLFLSAPPAYFRQKVIERYGATKVMEPRELTLEEKEEKAREKLMNEEKAGFLQAWDYLNFVYGAYFFMLSHEEIVDRQRIKEEYQNRLFDVVAKTCRSTGGLLYYYSPAVMLHGPQITPTMQELVSKVLEEQKHMERPQVYTGGTVSL